MITCEPKESKKKQKSTPNRYTPLGDPIGDRVADAAQTVVNIIIT